ncbi:hypothetical protein [Labilibaculum euxinus]|uniref:Uncharacterized protein n=1 Tax=Labilibaculum euxinus TaxID=2686357 RepID=A0A7M4D6C5_9BACT|nr:hypothetical protein [Labilibaculum euxinus]MUP38204.1 hypothetical protein [Labilibaculum euxinus]MVB07409.1 hypothetical protein [Labilibaculum euxinus]
MYARLTVSVVMCFVLNTVGVMGQLPVKALIVMESEVHSCLLKANVQNVGHSPLTLRYIFEVTKKGHAGDTKTIQKGIFTILDKSISALSESRINLSKADKLIAKLSIYQDNLIVAQDSVVLQGDNY